MVGDGHPLVVGQQRIVRAEQPPDCGGMVDRGVEVGEIPHLRRDAILGGRLGHEQRTQAAQQAGHPRAAPVRAPRAAPRAACDPSAMKAFRVGCAQAASACAARPSNRAQLVQRPEVEHGIADGHSAAEALGAAGRPESRRTAGSAAENRRRRRWRTRPSCCSAGSCVALSALTAGPAAGRPPPGHEPSARASHARAQPQPARRADGRDEVLAQPAPHLAIVALQQR